MRLEILIAESRPAYAEGKFHTVAFTAEGWDVKNYADPTRDVLRDYEIRRHITRIAVPCRRALGGILAEGISPEDIVGRATQYGLHLPSQPEGSEGEGGEGALLTILYTVGPMFQHLYLPPPQQGAEVREAAARTLVDIPVAQSHFGAIPLYPPLQVLCAARPFFTKAMLQKLRPLGAILSGSKGTPHGGGEGSDAEICPGEAKLENPEGVFWHYSRFPWKGCGGGAAGAGEGEGPVTLPRGSGWCKTYFFYSSPRLVGPLALYPLASDGTLRGTPPDSDSSEKRLHFVKCTVDYAEGTTAAAEVAGGRDPALGGELQVLQVGDNLIREVSTELLLHTGWEEFCAVCVAHGMLAPTQQLLLEVGLEKALIPVCHFFPFAPVVGFAYSHTFSSVPEPETLCLTADAASDIFSASVNSPEACELLEFARACYADDSHKAVEDVAPLLSGIPSEKLSALLCHRAYGMSEACPEGDDVRNFLTSTFNPAVVAYCASRKGVVIPDALHNIAEQQTS